jgi:hypothetical protein
MKKYIVTVYEVHSLDIEVEAENEEDAKDKANEVIEAESPIGEYYCTRGTDYWDVLDLGEVE